VPPTRIATIAAVLATAVAQSAGGQESVSRQAGDTGWNDPAVLELVRRARDLRQSDAVDPDFRSYTAAARGYVYFFFDRPDSADRVLVKADQVALDVGWRAPSHTRQTIVGLRDEKLLPTDIRYHLDHLTIVQDDFGDRIVLGDGDEVSAVVHPMALGAEARYDFRLTDSLTISYAAGAEEVRVYEVTVRPRDFDEPAFVGSVYLDRDRAAIVRMSFSFTPASYVDPYLDFIRVSLDNSLWMERWWLPYRQQIEIRREMPFFDLLAGSVIRARFEIRDYDFNADLAAEAFQGRTVRSLSVAEREAFPFERGLFDDLEESGGLSTPPAIEEVETRVRAAVEDQVMSGLAPIRLHGARISDFARYDRAEGVFVGAGVALQPVRSVQVRATGGYAFGRGRASGTLRVSDPSTSTGAWTPSLEAYVDALGDIGGHVGATLLENTITSAAGARDYLDPYFRRGVSLSVRSGVRPEWSVGLRFESHRQARDVVSDGPESEFRPVRSIDEGELGAVEIGLKLGLPGSGRLGLKATGGRLGNKDFASLDADARWRFQHADGQWTAETSVTAGVVSAGAPAQTLYLLGGRHTLMGHEYRLFAGHMYWLARGEVTVPLRPPWVGIRGFAALGSTVLHDAQLPADWAARDSWGLRGAVGLGLSLGWDSLRFDVGRAVWGTGWEAMLSVAPEFRAWM
jgi:hypothetical protein